MYDMDSEAETAQRQDGAVFMEEAPIKGTRDRTA